MSTGPVPESDAALWCEGDLVGAGFGRYAPPKDYSGALLAAVDTLQQHGIPPIFAAVYAEAWHAAKSLASYASKSMGEPYDVGADAWFFEVHPGASGWSAHRGRSDMVLRGPSGAPDLLDTWVPLTDVGVHDACMHVLPLGSDPHYPHQMALEPAGLPPVPLPVQAGQAVVWDANVLHAGGPCDAILGKRRVSMGFTVGARARAAGRGYAAAKLDTFEERLDLLAHQIFSYGAAANAPEDWFLWAKGHLTLKALTQQHLERR